MHPRKLADRLVAAREKFSRAAPDYLKAIWIALLTWGILQLDPFGLEKASNAASRRVAMRLIAAYYPVGDDQVSVVLIDDDYLRDTGGSWPLLYSSQGAILRRILDYQPKAVFVDILYRHPHATLAAAAIDAAPTTDAAAATDAVPTIEDLPQHLVDAVRRPPRVPVFFADLPPPAPTDSRIECSAARHATMLVAGSSSFDPALQKILEHARARAWSANSAFVGWQGCGERYPLAIGGSEDYLTPAYALYKAGCAGAGASDCALLGRFERGRRDPIVVEWGALPSALHVAGYSDGECQPPRKNSGLWWQRTKIAFEQVARSFAQVAESSQDALLRLPCPSIDTLRAGELMRGDPERVGAFLAGRHVIVGVHLDGVQDHFISPVNGLIPGATFNAMALDNLLRFDAAYLREWSLNATRVAEAVALVLVVCLVVFLGRRGWLDSKAMRASYLVVVALLCLVTLVWGLASTAWLLLLLALLVFLLRDTRELAFVFLCVAVIGLAVEFFFVALLRAAPGNWIGMLLAAATGVQLASLGRVHKPQRPAAGGGQSKQGASG